MRAGRLTVEPRPHHSVGLALGVAALAVAAAVALGGVFLLWTGHDPVAVYLHMVRRAFGSQRAWEGTLVSATPLILTGLAAAVAFKMLVWNIGAEGQLYLGAIGAAGAAIALGPGTPAVVTVTVALLVGVVAGAAWGALAGIPRVALGTNEIITTLMLNFVALHLMNYLIFGSGSPWRDPDATNFPQGRPIPDAARLPELSGRLHWGLAIALVTALVVWLLVRWTRWGFELRVVGDSPAAARYAGIPVKARILGVMLLSGGLAGLAGAVQVSGLIGALEPRALTMNLGFTGIIVAALARLSPAAIVPVAVLIGALNNAASSLQIVGVPVATVLMLQGAILLFAVSGEFLLRYRIGWSSSHEVEEAVAA